MSLGSNLSGVFYITNQKCHLVVGVGIAVVTSASMARKFMLGMKNFYTAYCLPAIVRRHEKAHVLLRYSSFVFSFIVD